MIALRILVVLTAVTVSFACLVDESNLVAAETHPNIIFILADDMGYGDLGCYGRSDIETPNLDQLAREGVRFTSHYANGPECTPTRTALMTGRYPQRVGGLECAIGTGNVGRYDDAIRLQLRNDLGLPETQQTIVRLMKEAGYNTAICGKWHLGYEPKFSPNRHGFDFAFYCIGGAMDYFHYLDNVAGYNLFLNGAPVNRDGYFTDLLSDQAIEYLEQQSSETPFFLYVPYTCPHTPYQGPDDLQSDPLPLDSPLWSAVNASPETYVAMIEQMDRRIGDILAALQQQQLAENTVVIFTSDNGGTASSRNEPYSGTKGTTYEGGIRVPAIVRWPGRIPAGVESNQACITMDWTASMARIANVSGAANEPWDGIDIIKHVRQQKPNFDRTLYWRKPRGDTTWKAVRQGNLKYVAKRVGNEEKQYLFDLASDPAERNDLKGTRPKELQRLRSQWEDWETEVRQHRRGQP